MKKLIVVLIGAPIALGLGVVLGWLAGPKPDHTQVQAYVDCYDRQGNLVRDNFDKYGAVITQCAPGQYARLHQPNPPVHIELTKLQRRGQ